MAITWKKIAFDADLLAHIALTTAHGAVSAATASKMVVRDASARAKFAAPGASGDVLIKGTRHLIAEMPTLTTGKAWKGVGGVPAEADWPAAGASLTLSNTEVFNGALTANATWEDLDLSGTVGAKVTLVLLAVVDTTSSVTFAVRTNGDADQYYGYVTGGVARTTVQVNTYHALIAVTDATGKIEILSDDASDTHIIDIIAYIN